MGPTPFPLSHVHELNSGQNDSHAKMTPLVQKLSMRRTQLPQALASLVFEHRNTGTQEHMSSHIRIHACMHARLRARMHAYVQTCLIYSFQHASRLLAVSAPQLALPNKVYRRIT